MSDSTLPDGRLREAYLAERRCCSQCDAKKRCHVCDEPTLFACSDCQIDFHATVYVCAKRSCRDEHERKCSARLRALLASPLHAGANLKESDETKVSGLLGDAGRGVEALLGGASQDSERRIPEIRARLDGWRDNCAEKGGNRDYVLIFEAHAADDIAWLLERCRPLHAGAEPEEERQCGAALHVGFSLECTRTIGHNGRHEAHGTAGDLIASWNNAALSSSRTAPEGPKP